MKILRRMAIFLALFSLILLLMACSSGGDTEAEVTISFVDGETVISEGVLDIETLVVPIAPSKSNMQFNGWYFDAEFSEPFDIEKIADHITDNAVKIYARYVPFEETKPIINITFMVENNIYATTQISSNGTFTMPDNPTLEFHTFNGWYIDKKCVMKFDYMRAVTNGIHENMTLYAKFTENTAHFTFVVEGANYKKMDVKMSKVAVLPVGPYIEGKVFLYWREIGSQDAFNIDNYYAEKDLRDVELEAVLINQSVNVKLYDESELIKTIALRHDEDLVLEPLERTLSHDFDNWVDANGGAFDLDTYNADKFRGDIELYASWTPRINTLKFYVGKTLYATITVDEKLSFDMPTPPTSKGQIFDRWQYTVNKQNIIFDKEKYLSDMDRKDIDMYAYFEDIYITVNWIVNDKISHTDKLKYGENITEYVAPELSNNTFKEWTYNGSKLDIKMLNDTIAAVNTPGKVIQIISIYEPKVTKIQFIHDYYEWEMVYYDDNTVFKYPKTPTLEGYEFVGWYYDDGTFLRKFDPKEYKKDPNRQNIALYSHFVKIKK